MHNWDIGFKEEIKKDSFSKLSSSLASDFDYQVSGSKIAAISLTSCLVKDRGIPEDLPNLCFTLLFTSGYRGTGKFSFGLGTLKSRMKCAFC